MKKFIGILLTAALDVYKRQDFIYTSDGALVVRHDFDADGSYYRLEIEPGSNLVMDSNTFQNEKIIYEQTPMTARCV